MNTPNASDNLPPLASNDRMRGKHQCDPAFQGDSATPVCRKGIVTTTQHQLPEAIKYRRHVLLGILALVSLFTSTFAHAQCDWYNGAPTVTYLGCATDGSGHVIGRNFRIGVPLIAYQRCGPALPGWIFATAVNTSSGYYNECWRNGCDSAGGVINQNFTLYDTQFNPGQTVRIDYWGNPGSSGGSFVCQQGVASFTYPPASPPIITRQPQSQSACQGTTAIFTVAASGGTHTYQWRKNDVVLAGQTGASLTLSAVQPIDAGVYDVLVSNGCGTTTSDPATLTVSSAPTITRQPQSQVVCLGGRAEFCVEATDANPLSYQWRRNGVPVPGATSPCLVISQVVTTSGGTYSVEISNGTCGVVSGNAQLTVLHPPVITVQPQSVRVCDGSPVSLTVSAGGSLPLSYQWWKDGLIVLGATEATHRIASASTTDEATYSCVVSNSCGTTISSNATIAVLPEVRIFASEPTVSEGGIDGAWIYFTRVGATNRPLEVYYSTTGTASNGVDYYRWIGLITIPAGSLWTAQSLIAMDDGWLERNETAVITLLANSNYCVSAEAPNVTVTILDNDSLALVVSTNRVSVPEGGTAGFTVQLNGRPTSNVSVEVRQADGDASLRVCGDADHVFTQANWNTPKTFNVCASHDSDSTNGVATFIVTGPGLSNVVVIAVEVDDDPPPSGVRVPVFYGATTLTGMVDVPFFYQPQVSVYALTQNRTSWTAAEATAVALDGHLVTISSTNEQAALERVFMGGIGDRAPYWIGLNDEVVEGEFAWASGDPLGYVNWNAGEPNNIGNQDYGAINLGHALNASTPKGTWSDTFLNGYTGSGGPADGPYRGIMELPLPSDARFYATNLPFALSVNPFTGAISGMPTTTGTEPITLVLIASNAVATELHLQVTVTSVLRMSRARYYPNGRFVFQIDANPDVTYALEYKNSLSDPFWSVAVTLTGPTAFGDETRDARFYRLRQISPSR